MFTGYSCYRKKNATDFGRVILYPATLLLNTLMSSNNCSSS